VRESADFSGIEGFRLFVVHSGFSRWKTESIGNCPAKTSIDKALFCGIPSGSPSSRTIAKPAAKRSTSEGAEPPAHFHRWDEAFYVIDGEIDFGGTSKRVKAGGFVSPEFRGQKFRGHVCYLL
jgi:hypothetical protein